MRKHVRIGWFLLILLLLPSAFGQGTRLWMKRYNGTGNDEDYGFSVATDAQGNVYVAGAVIGATTSFDYVLIKYTPGGALAWSKTYNGPGNGEDWARAVAVDAKGDVYVTGYSTGSGTNFDYATIKYDKAGARKWVQRFDGFVSSADQAFSIVVDDFDNVTVTGTTITDASNGRDWATISYNADGRMRWASYYQGPGNTSDFPTSLAADRYGNVAVAGLSGGDRNLGYGFDLGVVKYGNTGFPLWMRTYTGPGIYSNDWAGAAIDRQDNVILAGSSDSGGTQEFDYVTRKYDEFGNFLWGRTLNGGGYDSMRDLAVDASGNVVVTGYSEGMAVENDDYFTVKYSSNGTKLWSKKLNGAGNGNDIAQSVAVDTLANVVVTGYTESPEEGAAGVAALGNYDITTVKYGPDGTVKWIRRVPAGFAFSLALDGSNNILVTGRSYGTTSLDVATIKYSP